MDLSQLLGGMTGVAAIALGIGIDNIVRKVAPRLTAWLFLLAGIGVAGWVGILLKSSTEQLNRTFNQIGQSLIGASVSLVIGAGLLTWLMHDLRKKGKVSKIAPYLALIVPSFLPIFLAALSTIPALRDVSQGFGTFFASLKG